MKIEELALDPELLWLVTMGPGYGEAIVLAVPGKTGLDWIAIDSLRRQDLNGDFNPTRALLTSHNARLAAVALTHPHQDHVRGMVELLERRHPDAPVGCVPAFFGSDAMWNPRSDAAKVLDRGAGLAALNRIDEIWRTEPSSRWELIMGQVREVGLARVEVLHPAAVPERKPRDLNQISSPMLLEWESCCVLLGADLPSSGWRKVEKMHRRPENLAGSDALKGSHHGSAVAQHHIAIGEPPPTERFCAVTPYNRGKRPLPDYGDDKGIDQLLGSHREVCVTAVPDFARNKRTPRISLTPDYMNFGGLVLSLEAPAVSPREGWVAVAFDASGAEVRRESGPASGTIV